MISGLYYWTSVDVNENNIQDIEKKIWKKIKVSRAVLLGE